MTALAVNLRFARVEKFFTCVTRPSSNGVKIRASIFRRRLISEFGAENILVTSFKMILHDDNYFNISFRNVWVVFLKP